jgi:hypothetical protein
LNALRCDNPRLHHHYPPGLNGGTTGDNCSFVTLTVIPEPAALLGNLGLQALLRRRRVELKLLNPAGER